MLSIIEMIIFAVLLGLTFYYFFTPLIFRYKLVKLGKPTASDRFDNKGNRIFFAIKTFFAGFIRKERPFTGIIHIFILYGSLTFDTISVSHILEGFFSSFHIHPIHLMVADIFSILVFIALAFFGIRRYILKPKNYSYDTNESMWIYLFLFTVTLTYLIYEGATLAKSPSHGEYSFVGNFFSNFISGHRHSIRFWWWIHIINVFAFIIYVGRSKYMHMFLAPINSALQKTTPKNVVDKLDLEDEDIEEFGVSRVTDISWKDLLDSFACIDCGRCDDYCPANESGKALSPKNMVQKIKKHLLEDGKEILANKDNEEFEGKMLVGYDGEEGIFTEDEIWACTTCGSCTEVCPSKNEPFTKIIEMRQAAVLNEYGFPKELKSVFKGLNKNQNPWGLGANKRMEWAGDMEVPEYDDENTEYLLHLGCAASFDDRSQKVARTLVKVLTENNVSFGVLGEDEVCCGETAKRLGEEATAQELIETNIETFGELKVTKILTACPHCYNTFKNEYPQFDGKYEVVHHSQLISNLLKENKIKIDPELEKAGKVVFHDPCYLGRANDEYDAPRDVLNAAPGIDLVEHSRSKDHAHCCGAGGGRFWLEEDEGDRINHNRVKQLLETEATTIATSCPYCMRMMSDGKNDLGKGDDIVVKDIVELIVKE